MGEIPMAATSGRWARSSLATAVATLGLDGPDGA